MRLILAALAVLALSAPALAEPAPVDMAAPVVLAAPATSLPVVAPASPVASALAWLHAGQPYTHLEILVAVLLGVLLLLEQILPRTKYVRANSTVELLANLLVKAFGGMGLVGKVLAVLATPPPASQPQPPQEPAKPLSSIGGAGLVLLVAGGLLSACASGTDGARQALAAAERVSTQGVSALEQYDLIQQQAIVDAAVKACAGVADRTPCIEEHGKAPIAAYRAKRAVVVNALVDESAVIGVGSSLIPLVDSGLRKSSDLSQWLDQLLAAGLAVKDALHAFGVTLPGGL